jgi:addiction module HigA family antidote
VRRTLDVIYFFIDLAISSPTLLRTSFHGVIQILSFQFAQRIARRSEVICELCYPCTDTVVNVIEFLENAMLPENRIPTHPGEILLEEFLVPMNVSQVAFAAHIRVPVQRVNEIVRGKRGVTPETAWLFVEALGTSPEFWLNLQSNFDLVRSRPKRQIARMAVAA